MIEQLNAHTDTHTHTHTHTRTHTYTHTYWISLYWSEDRMICGFTNKMLEMGLVWPFSIYTQRDIHAHTHAHTRTYAHTDMHICQWQIVNKTAVCGMLVMKCVCACMRVCVCVTESKRERESVRVKEKKCCITLYDKRLYNNATRHAILRLVPFEVCSNRIFSAAVCVCGMHMWMMSVVFFTSHTHHTSHTRTHAHTHAHTPFPRTNTLISLTHPHII